MAKRRKKAATPAGCSVNGVGAKGRLKKGYRWAKGRKRCAVPVMPKGLKGRFA